MALVISNSSLVQKPRISSFRGDRKPWMLKDFLLDDLGSCSSSGFRSFPRRQCCVAVRNLIELEVRGRNSAVSTSKRLFKSSSSSSSSASSRISNAIHKASLAIIGAVKLLPFKSPGEKVNSKGKKKTLLPRSLTKKLFRKSLWKKNSSEDDRKKRECEIERWISSGAAIVEKYQPSDLSNETTTTTTTITTSASTTNSTNSDNWSELDSEFTQPRSSVDENAVEGKRHPSAKSKKRVTVGDDAVESATTKKWSQDGEKEQLSPISVLKFPDEDEEIGSSSPFTRRFNHLEGTKEKLMQKLRRFECLSRIGKIKLESRLSPAIEDLEKDSPKLSFQSSPSPLRTTNITPVNEEDYEKKVTKRLMNIIKVKTISSNTQKLNVKTLLIDFFREGLTKGRGKNREVLEDTLLIEAENWLYGRSHDEVSMGWKVKDKRKVYVNGMEEGGEWRTNRDAEKEEVGIKLEDEILASLVDEMIGEFSNLELLSLLK